ncbi:hypothetical protein E1176_12565, partial [Fulvivirga sp. RKSG066]|uniref:sensor histidine kinase n=1 Tax=Fulvivirga aurantia TaxID=2529383 RepID=UPI0012BBA4FA
FSQAIVWEDGDAFKEIGEQVEILEDPTGKISFNQASSREYRNNYKPSESTNLSLGYTDSFFWFRFTINNDSKNLLMLEIAQAGLPEADLYYEDKTGNVKHYEAGYEVDIENKLINSSFQVFPLPTGEITYYLRVNTNSEPIPVRLYSQHEYRTRANQQMWSYGLYSGLMLFVVLLNMFFFFSLRKKIYLFYSLVVLIYFFYSAAVIDGFIIYALPVDLVFLYTTIPAIGITVQTIYCLIFLEARKYVPKLYKTVIFIIAYFAIWGLIKFFFPFSIVQPINTVNAMISFFVMAFVGVKVGARGNKMGYYFAVAYFIYFLLVCTQAIYINTGSPDYIGGLSHVAYATLFEVILLSFLLSKRMEWKQEEIIQERYEAQEKLLETTLENERLIQMQNIELENKVAQRTAQLETKNLELAHMNDQLGELIREKDGIVSAVTHDLKSPLSKIEGFTRLIPIGGPINANQEEYIQRIMQQVEVGNDLIRDLLELHMYDHGDVKLNTSELEVNTYINSFAQNYEHTLQSKDQKLVINLPEQPVKIVTDEYLLTRILDNFLTNAMKFSNMHKRIWLTVSKENDTLLISVKDEGPGISEADQEEMFKMFKRLTAQPTAGETSNGLGLAICKTLANQLGADIKVWSEVGAGTELTLLLPLNRSF